ncbi:MAG: hypothetical protein IJS13_01705 [Paludibacteraceae bacterium]|nr:hypothetical protein [Paludibacteraceae bacterium]
MKTKTFKTTLLAIITILIFSCDKNTNTFETEKKALEYFSEYTYDNYTIEEKEYFINEKGDIDIYVVTQSGIYATKTNNKTENIFLCITMTKQHTDDTRIALIGTYQNGVKWELGIGNDIADAIERVEHAFELEEDEMYLENTMGQWMILKKGIGIYKMGDNYGHSLEKLVINANQQLKIR